MTAMIGRQHIQAFLETETARIFVHVSTVPFEVVHCRHEPLVDVS